MWASRPCRQSGLRSLRGCQPGQQQTHGNDGPVIDQRGQRRNAELTPHEQQGRDACPAQKENLCGQDDAHKKGQPRPLLRPEAGGHHLRQPGRKGHAAKSQQGGGSRHPAENAGKKAPCVRLILLKPAGQQGDDGDGHKAASQQIIDDVRNHKGGEIHIGFAACAELPRNDLVARKAHEARKNRAGRQYERGCAHTLLRGKQGHQRPRFLLPLPALRPRAPEPPLPPLPPALGPRFGPPSLRRALPFAPLTDCP